MAGCMFRSRRCIGCADAAPRSVLMGPTTEGPDGPEGPHGSDVAADLGRGTRAPSESPSDGPRSAGQVRAHARTAALLHHLDRHLVEVVLVEVGAAECGTGVPARLH